MDCRDCMFCIDDDMVLYCRENGFRLIDDGTEEANGNREPCERFRAKWSVLENRRDYAAECIIMQRESEIYD